MTGQSPETIPGRRNNGSATDTALRCLNRRPTTKQLKLIKELNGDARSVRTRHDASELISRLRQEEAERRYREGLGSLPPPGRGHDLHPRLLSMANLAVRAGIPPDQASAEIEALIPPGGRLVPEREIMEAVRKAYGSPSCGSESPQRARRTGKRARRTGKRARRRSSPAARHRASKPGQERQIDRTGERDAIIAAGPEVSPVEFRRISPIQISNSPHEQEQLVLSALFEPGQYVFAGRRYDAEVTAAGVLLSRLRSGLSLGPYLIVNPFTGQKAPCKDSAKLSYRCDNALAKLRYAVAEFDALPMGGQLAFWRRVQLPIVAVVWSGGRSLHAWIRVDCSDQVHWDGVVRAGLYAEHLVPMGVDPQCANPSRLTRLPGAYRVDKEAWQSLLFFDPQGGGPWTR